MAARTLCTFWTGPASPYQTLCIASWIAHGFNVVVYTADTDITLPPGAERRPAEEVLDLGGHILRYGSGFGAGSPALHADLFRCKLVERGDWWLDADLVMLNGDLPDTDFFLARQAHENSLGNSIMRLPAHSPLISEAIREIEAMAHDARWGETGPYLITRLAAKHGLTRRAHARNTVYEIDYTEVIKLFDPDARDEVERRLASSLGVHLWNAIWQAIGFPQELGPPEGSYLDTLLGRYGARDMFALRAPFASVRTWWDNRERHLRLETELNAMRARTAAAPTFTFNYSYPGPTIQS